MFKQPIKSSNLQKVYKENLAGAHEDTVFARISLLADTVFARVRLLVSLSEGGPFSPSMATGTLGQSTLQEYT